MESLVKIDGVEIPNVYVIEWEEVNTSRGSIDELKLKVDRDIDNLIGGPPKSGISVSVFRGFEVNDEECVIRGQVTKIHPNPDEYEFTVKGRLIDAIKSKRIRSWDKNIDPAQGIGSEIFKDLCDNSGLNYTEESVPSTGLTDANRIDKFIQNDEDDFEMMNKLAELYNRTVRYNYDLDVVEFLPKDIVEYPITLNVGAEINNQPKWAENMEQLCNRVKIFGATVYDTMTENFTGPTDEIELLKIPEDTELRVNHSTTNDLLTRGQKDVGVIGVDYNYEVDVENKIVKLDQDYNDIFIRYGAQVPIPLILEDTFSINEYGGENKIPHTKTFYFSEIKSFKDAENKGRNILKKFSMPFISSEKIRIDDSVLKEHGYLKPGIVIHIKDEYANKDLNLSVNSIRKKWPHAGDIISAGDETWRTEDWQVDQMKKISAIYKELNKNQQIIITAKDFSRDIKYERRFFRLTKKDRSYDGTSTFIPDHPTFGILDIQSLGDAHDTLIDWEEWNSQGISFAELKDGHIFLECGTDPGDYIEVVSQTMIPVDDLEKVSVETDIGTFELDGLNLSGDRYIKISLDDFFGVVFMIALPTTKSGIEEQAGVNIAENEAKIYSVKAHYSDYIICYYLPGTYDIRISQGDNIYKEFLYDDTFFGG